MNALADYVNAAIQRLNWSARELARRAGRSNASISDVLSGKSKATAQFCLDMADALGEQPLFMLSLGGFVEVAPSVTEENEAIDILRRLSPQDRQAALTMLRGLASAPGNSPTVRPADAPPVPYTDNPGNRCPAAENGCAIAEVGVRAIVREEIERNKRFVYEALRMASQALTEEDLQQIPAMVQQVLEERTREG